MNHKEFFTLRDQVQGIIQAFKKSGCMVQASIIKKYTEELEKHAVLPPYLLFDLEQFEAKHESNGSVASVDKDVPSPSDNKEVESKS